ncbi:MAG: hypothetical protein WC875_05795 [Candidatus Absconditabacterales bacterium]|jgi:molecular chaperone DnaK (HSP70)
MQSIKETKEYIMRNIQIIDPENNDVDEMILQDIIEENLLDKITDMISPEDKEAIENSIDDTETFEKKIREKLPNYPTLLDEITTEVLSEYLSE